MQDRRSFAGLLKFTLRTTGDDENDEGCHACTSIQRLVASGGGSTLCFSARITRPVVGILETRFSRIILSFPSPSSPVPLTVKMSSTDVKKKKNIKGKIHSSYPFNFWTSIRSSNNLYFEIQYSQFSRIPSSKKYNCRRRCSNRISIGWRKNYETIYRLQKISRGRGGDSERGGKAKTSADCVARSAPWKKERTHLVKTCRYFPLLFLLLAKYTGSGLC